MSSIEQSGKRYWRSLEDLADTPEFRAFVEREFPFYADEMLSPNRRDFLKIMGASMALAGMTACRWPSEPIVPFASRPEGLVPGRPERYATAMELGGAALGLLVTSYDGRPVKIEGNPMHPSSRGSTDALGQASLLELYDPDRSRSPARIEAGAAVSATWEEFAAFADPLFLALRERGGEGLRVLAEASASPTLARVRSRLGAVMPRAVWHEYEPFSRESERAGTALVFGRPMRLHPVLERADVIVSLDDDFLMAHPAAVSNARAHASRRRADDGTMSRLYVVESACSITGAAADHRLAIPPHRGPAVALRLAAELFLKEGVALPAGAEAARGVLAGFLGGPSPSPIVTAMARDLAAHAGRAVVVAGPRQPAEVHALAHLMQLGLGGLESVVRYTADPDPARPSHVEALRDLVQAIDAGKVDTLIVLGGNPAFNAPADLEFEKRLPKVRNRIHLGAYRDETSALCTWHVNRAHYLESWGDARSWDGTIAPVQPLIEPLWGGRTPIELVAMAAGEPSPNGYDLVRGTFRERTGESGFEPSWGRFLHDGVLPGSAWPPVEPSVSAVAWLDRLGDLARAEGPDAGSIGLVFALDRTIHDGRFANNGWLQELPDPLTRLTWDNAVLLSPGSAEKLGVAQGDMVRLSHDGRDLEMPVFVLPGQAEAVATVNPGYGRRMAGRVGNGAGFDAYRIRTSTAMDHAVCRVEKTGARCLLATTQDHHVIDRIGIAERSRRVEELVREGTLEQYLRNPAFAKHRDGGHEAHSLWKEHEYPGRRWGLAIDLSACIGCGACTVACQAENNIPVVGKNEVARGREMHWIRVDRYFSGATDDPDFVFQPMACHHCESAPCEQVCPVGATVHDHEGLNVMVYNRCVGTRYCSNNCPYKVRRFNWFNNHKSPSAVEMMVYNPEVSVRSRGVMEKCTFCVQRIEAAKIDAKNERRGVRDGEIVTACQQVCPTQAIVFGDLNDPESAVRRLQAHERAYGVLEELNVSPRVRYLARLRNREADGEGEREGRA